MSQVHSVCLFVIGIVLLIATLFGFFVLSGSWANWTTIMNEPFAWVGIYGMVATSTLTLIALVWPVYVYWWGTMRTVYWSDDDE